MIDPYIELNLTPDQATDETVREAYMKGLRAHPPDREPDKFERIRRAYEMIKDEKSRIELKLFGLEEKQSFLAMLPEENKRPRVGAEAWLAVIDEESKRKTGKNPYG